MECIPLFAQDQILCEYPQYDSLLSARLSEGQIGMAPTHSKNIWKLKDKCEIDGLSQKSLDMHVHLHLWCIKYRDLYDF